MSRNLCSPVDVRMWLSDSGIKVTPEMDLGEDSDLLIGVTSPFRFGLIQMASRRFEIECGRAIDFCVSQSIVISGNGGNLLELPVNNLPIVTLLGITLEGSVLDVGEIFVEDAEAGIIRRKFSPTSGFFFYGEPLAPGVTSRFDMPRFPKGAGNIQVTYTWGFADSTGTQFLSPAPVVEAVSKNVAANLLYMDPATAGRGRGAVSESIGYISKNFGQWRYKGLLDKWDRDWERIVNMYRLGV